MMSKDEYIAAINRDISMLDLEVPPNKERNHILKVLLHSISMYHYSAKIQRDYDRDKSGITIMCLDDVFR